MEPTEARAVDAVVRAHTWDERVSLIRNIPQEFGEAHRAEIYSAIADKVFVPNLAPDFAYVHHRDEYELDRVVDAYQSAHRLTNGFRGVEASELVTALRTDSKILLVFRLFLGLTQAEFAASTGLVAELVVGLPTLSASVLARLEEGRGRRASQPEAAVCAEVVDRVMRRSLFAAGSPEVRAKIEKPDTARGWESVREFADHGVPFATFLHQRHYGGAFRQILDATSTPRGKILEDAVESLFRDNRVPYMRADRGNEALIRSRFGVRVNPSPDFVVFHPANVLRGMLECKKANDGGTARDKTARFRNLRQEGLRLGGVPVFAVLSGLGWQRTGDALGPVVRDTDGRVFMIPTLAEILTVQPFPDLIGKASD